MECVLWYLMWHCEHYEGLLLVVEHFIHCLVLFAYFCGIDNMTEHKYTLRKYRRSKDFKHKDHTTVT
jgi:hypothetical protein